MIIEVSNLKVNSVSATSTTVRVTGPFPTLTWAYDLIDRVDTSDTIPGIIDAIYTAKAAGFEIRVGTANTNLGNNSFSGNLAATGYIATPTTSWRYRGTSLTRGSTYYGQIRVTDGDANVSAWKTFTIRYNSLPTVSAATISPSTPTIHDDLLLSYTIADTDGDTDQGSTIWWFKNGIHERLFDNKTLIESQYLSFDDEWSAQVFPYDGYEIGKPLASLAVTIDKEAPTVSNAVILPENPTYNDPLYAKYTFSSPDAETDQSVIKWFVNGFLFTGTLKCANTYTIVLSGGTQIDGTYVAEREGETDVWSTSGMTLHKLGVIWSVQFAVSGLYFSTFQYTAGAQPPCPPNTGYVIVSGNLSGSPNITISNNLPTGGSGAFVRMDLNAGDEVHYEIQPNDGEVANATWVSSPTVTIVAPSFKVEDLRCNGEIESLASTLTPALTWGVTGPRESHTTVRVKIGTAPASGEVYDSGEIESSQNVFVIPDGILEKGMDYCLSVAVGGADGVDGYSTIHVRTAGSRWQESVSNTTGWTIETTMKVGSTAFATPPAEGASSSSSSSSLSSTYQGIRIYDGTRYAELRVYTDRLSLTSGSTKEYKTDNTDFSTLTIVGQGTNIKVYKNYELVIDGTGIFTSTTSSKVLEFGAVGTSPNTQGEYISLFYTTEGDYDPTTDEKYFDTQYETFFSTDGSIDYVTGQNTDIYYAVSDENAGESSTVYRLSDGVKPELVKPKKDSSLVMNSVQTSEDGNYSYFCHNNGLTVFRSKEIGTYDSEVKEEHPTTKGWSRVSNGAGSYTLSSGVRISTVGGGKLYFSQAHKGTKWFDDVDNKHGWTVAFSLKVDEIVDDELAVSTDKPEGFGIYVNDGKYQEVIMFFADQIAFRNAGTYAAFDTTETTEYVLVGQGGWVRLFYKANDKYSLLAEAKFSKAATNEGNGGRPSIAEDANGNRYAVWHDDGEKTRAIYYSYLSSTGTAWTAPLRLVSESYDASNPNVVVDGVGNVYVAFESARSDSTDISMVVKNAFGWSKPFLLDSAQYHAYGPKMAVDDSNNVHLVWEDHRQIVGAIMYRSRDYLTGKWSDIVQLTADDVNAFRPSIANSSDNDILFVTYTVRGQDGLSNIWATTKQVGNASWAVPVQISVSGRDADYSDVATQDGSAYIVWHDNKTTGYEIYGRLTSSLLGFVGSPLQITTKSYPCRFPCAGTRKGSDSNTGNVYVVFETGGDIDPTGNDGWSRTDTGIGVIYYHQSIGYWLGSNQNPTVGGTPYGGIDVAFTAGDLREFRRPAIAKTFKSDAHVLYEADMGADEDEYLPYAERFTMVRDAKYTLSYVSSYSVEGVLLDLTVSGQLERKEVRFGDFSDNYSGVLTYGYVKYYAKEAVEPFQATLLLEGEPVFDASVNNTGDGWIAARGGLNFYFNRDSKLAKFNDGLFAQGPVTDVGFDHNNIMYVVADGSIFISHDHLNFYVAFDYITDARSIAFDSDNYLWVASASGLYKIDVYATTSTIAREGVSVIPSRAPASSSSSSGGSSGNGTAGGNEIKSDLTSGQNHYAFVLSPNLQVWNRATNQFETPLVTNWQHYAFAMTETQIPGTFVANFPTGVTTAAIYYTYIYLRAGATPASTDVKLQQGEVDWDGTKEKGYVAPTNTGVTPPTAPDVYTCGENVSLGYTSFNENCGMPTDDVRKVYVDSIDQVWATTPRGLVLIRGNRLNVFTMENSGLPSNDVRDVAIVNSVVRYVATTNGVARMFGTGFERINFNDSNWGEGATAVAWRSPNTLWVAADGKIIQLSRDAISGEYDFITFDPTEYANFTNVCKNSQRFSFDSLDPSYLLQVVVNGRIVHHGYRISNNMLQFDSPLLDSDRVEVAVRKDIEKWATLAQNKAEVLALGDVYRNMKKMIVNGTNIYGITSGDKNQIVGYDSAVTHSLPYDSIVLDSQPPTGELEFVEQIDGSIVKLKVVNAADNLSGLKEMRVSNYPNGTSDGETALPWIAYRDELEFDLGDDLGNIFTQFEFSGTSGRRLAFFKNELYAGTASPARIYRFNAATKVWGLVATLDESITTTSIEFMIVYKNALHVGTRAGSTGKLWSSGNGTDYVKQIDYAGKVYAATTLNNLLYVGADGSGGQLFTFDGVNSAKVANNVGGAIYALHGAKTSIYIGTGENGLLYRWDTVNSRLVMMVHDKDTQITAVGSALINPATSTETNPEKDFYLFAGTGTKGRIVKSVNGAPFNISLTSLPTKVTQLKNDALNQLHAVVGKNVYKYKNRSWAAVYTNKFPIEDIYFDEDGFTIIYAGGIKRIDTDRGVKKLYLSLRDVAGNESGNESIVTEIDIDDLTGFINQNRILELNEYGERLWSYDGDEPFFSADSVVVEEGEYYSEIFNGTSDHVSWESIYWDATVPEDTDLKVFVRTANSRSELLTAKFSKTFNKEDFEGGDLTNLSGQFIQFRVSLSTEVRGKSPKLYRINIRSRTRTAVHFFTTNFVLPSKMKGGIMTAQTFVPYAADIVFGINTHDSTDWSDYQIVSPDKLFRMDPTQDGKNLRVGIKFISPLNVDLATDELEEYSPYTADLWNNVVTFNFTNSSGSTGTYFFKIELYEDPDLSAEAFSTIYTGTHASAFAIDGVAAASTGKVITNGQTVSVLAALKGNATIRCNQFYYAKVSAVKGTTTTVLDDEHAFIANCNPNYENTIAFDYTNTTGASNAFHFRAMFYADAARTTLVKTYYSGYSQTGWTVNGGFISSGGYTIANGVTRAITFTPPQGDLTEDQYFLVIDYYDGTSFGNITKSPTIAITSESEYACGEYTDVAIAKDVGIQIELEEFTEAFGGKSRTRRTITFNL